MMNLMLPKTLFEKSNAANIMLLVSMLLVISPHLFRIPIWLSFFCVTLIIWRLFYESGKGRLPNQFVKLLLILIAVSAIVMSYQTIVGRNAGSAFLLLMFCLKLTEFKSSRDAFVIVFLGYFIVITGFLFRKETLVS